MKKLLYISIIGLSFATQGIATAQDGQGMDNASFTRLVCGYIVESDDTQAAVMDAYSAIQSIISDTQLETLRGLSNGDISPDSFCAGFDV
ncbi:MAG: hypothetical protein QNJ70_17480 [Xenococcaceae cyanobacterium MO_207.B15]|nr:hypothetical protein [Xenococcaceae cyanobacterium MO_207.B15]